MSWPPSGFGGLTSRFDLFKPVIAAMNGLALGGGFEIALACDIIIAADTARMGLPEPRVGLAALAGGMHRLPAQVGMKNAMGMMLTGRHIDAQEAYRLGLVQEVRPPPSSWNARSRGPRRSRNARRYRCARRKKWRSAGSAGPLEEAMHMRFEGISRMVSSEDFIEGPMAFAQKRKPQWKGR
jgi:crotonobetainyl-CoA hydratase